MQKKIALLCSLITAISLGFTACSPAEPTIVEVEKEVEKVVVKTVYKDGKEIITKTDYVCPNCLKKYETQEKAAECCGVQKELVEKIVTEIEYVNATTVTEPVEEVLHYLEGDGGFEYWSKTNYDDPIEAGTELNTLARNYDGFTARGFFQEGSTVYILYTKNIITLTLLNADLSIYSVLEGKYGSMVETIANPENENFHFDGWMQNDVNVSLPVTFPSENQIYTPSFHRIETYTITYVTEKGTAPSQKSVVCEQLISAGEKPRLENVTVSGTEYRFVGWYTDTEYTNRLSGTLSEDVTVYAKWELATNILGTKAIADTIGDIVLTDGSACSADDDLNEEQIENAVAIVFYSGSDDDLLGNKVLAVGVHLNNNNTLPWARSGTKGSNCRFEEIEVSAPSSFYLDSSTYSGDIYGGDNWEYICSVDPEGTADPAANYPIFNEVLNYVSNYETGVFDSNWYLPSFPELVELKRNVSRVNESLSKVVSVIFESSHWYWSSSTYSSNDSYCYEFNLINRENCTIERTYTSSDEMSICAIIEL